MTENTREITLDEAKQLYNSFDLIKPFLLSKFTKDELDGSTVTQEEFDKFFEDTIFPLIDYSKTKFLDRNNNISETPTSRIELRNSKDAWLFDYNYDQKDKHFGYSCDISFMLYTKFYLNDFYLQPRMKNLVKKHFNLLDVTPDLFLEK
jgi:hypothetical protein